MLADTIVPLWHVHNQKQHSSGKWRVPTQTVSHQTQRPIYKHGLGGKSRKGQEVREKSAKELKGKMEK